MKPHPTRPEHDLRELEPHQWYKYKYSLEKDAERYLEEFYCKYANAFREFSGPMGFVGGEFYAHHRGFIGVLGVLGLWCHAHHECEGDTYHHLVIVADCCFAGIWGATLERIMKVEPDALKDTINCSSNIRCRFSVPPTNLKHLMVACLHHYGVSCRMLKNYFWRVILRSTSMMSLCLMTLKHSILSLSAPQHMPPPASALAAQIFSCICMANS